MPRKLIVNIHLILAAFFAPILIITGISGGLYLIGEKGTVEQKIIYDGALGDRLFSTDNRQSEIERFVSENNLDYQFEYVKGGKNSFITRPSSRQYLSFTIKGDQLKVSQKSPNLVASIIELHKGHGPRLFKTFQKWMAIALFLILCSGLVLGLTSKVYRIKTIAISLSGLAVFILLAVL